MADYYTALQLAQMLGLTETRIAELQYKGLLQPTVKDGRSYFSSRQAHCLRVAMRWARRDKITLEDAFIRAEERWLAHVNAMKE